jgi:CDP-paratose 2-epimerase
MKILVAGICGFAGSTLALAWREADPTVELVGVDNLSRAGSERNRGALRRAGVQVFHGDLRSASDVDALPAADWVVDAAANPSVLAGVDGRASSRQVVEHNLLGTVNLLEYCRRHRAGFVLLSTSRVYSLAALAALPLDPDGVAFRLRAGAPLPPGVSEAGIDERFSTAGPVSLYGGSKLASEALAVEYGEAFGFPVRIDRCGTLAGAGQFGRADQGIFAYWINSWIRHQPLRFIGFEGLGHQVRDCLHPADLRALLERQIASSDPDQPRVVNVAGGRASAISLRQLSDWCRTRFGEHEVGVDPRPRPFDLGWVVLDAGLARTTWNWVPARTTSDILEEIARHGEAHPEWLALSQGGG